MTDDERLADLLLLWEEFAEQGQDVSAEELCRDCPHLIPALSRRIYALKITSWLKKPGDGGEGGPPATPASPVPASPRTLANRYRLDDRIAEGGFAEVWKGFDLELQRAVAVKMPKTGRLPSAERIEQFVAEARRIASLKHPGVVPVFDVGREGDTCFIVEEFVDGGSLAERLANDRPTFKESVRLVTQVAETLMFAHGEGFVHRDIKPGNILIDRHGRALLADFGIARGPDQPEKPTPTWGTLAYMSPEQVQVQQIDGRTDIYALGVVLFELLTGQLPYQESDPVSLRRQIVSGSPPTFPRTIPRKLRKICRRCLARNLAQRYQTAGELVADLDRALRPSSSLRVVGVGTILLLPGVAIWLSLRGPGISDKNEQTVGLPTKASSPTPQPPDAESKVKATLALARLHYDKQEYRQAEEGYSEAIRLDPSSAEAFHRRAACKAKQGRHEASLTDYAKALELDPKNAGIFFNRSLSLLTLKEYEKALTDLKQALALDPQHPEQYRKALGAAHGRRAWDEFHKEQFKEALADMEAAVEYEPANADYYFKRGCCQYKLNDFQKALDDFTEAVKREPSRADYHLHRGYALEVLGRKDEAAKEYERAKAPRPDR